MPFPKADQDFKNPAEPRAGARVRDETSLLVPPEMKQAALDAIETCLAAEKRFWNKQKGDWDIEPDYPARLKAAELTLAYSEGRPVERRIELSLKGETWEEQRDRAMASPEGVKFLLGAGAISRAEADEALEKFAKNLKGSQE